MKRSTGNITKANTSSRSPLLAAAMLSVVLAVAKAVAYWLSGSIIVMGSLLDSISDSIVSFANHYIHSLSREEPDQEHPFGHGGLEVIAGFVQGAALAGFGLVLMFQSFAALRHPESTQDHNPESLWTAFALLLFAAITGGLISLFIARSQSLAEQSGERSLAVKADLSHYAGDFWYNLLNAGGVMAVILTEIAWLDAAFGLVGSFLFFKSAAPVLKNSLTDILHSDLSPEERAEIKEKILNFNPTIMGVHRLRLRRLGPSLFMDFHLKLPAKMSLEEAHNLGEKIATYLRAEYPRSDVLIHLDPDTEPDDDRW
jgi:ferrous-iron efflux pump FieF